MPRTTFYCYATIRRWNAAAGDYDEIDLDHYSSEPTVEAAEDDAREVWSEDGYSPSRVRVRPFDAPPGGDDAGFSIDPTDDGGALVVRDDGTVVAVVRPGHGVTAAEFDRAMVALDATFDRDEWGHG